MCRFFEYGLFNPRQSRPFGGEALSSRRPPLARPRVGYDRGTQQVLRELFEGLTRIGPDGLPQLALAKSVETSADGCTYLFTLHPSLWSNGLEVTAEDFVFAWKSSLNPNRPEGCSEVLFSILNARRARSGECSIDDVGIRSLNNHVLEVTFEHPIPYLFELLANPVFSPLCRTVVEKNPRFGTTGQYVSNGPFLLKERRLQSHIALERNPRYWNPDKPTLDRITFTIVEDPQAAYNMYLAKVLDWYGEPFGTVFPEMASRLYSNGLLTCRETGASYQLLIQTRAPHLRSVSIRRALAHAIDRKNICEKVLRSGESPAFSLSPQPLSFLQKLPFEDNEPHLAEALFDEGLLELGFTRESYPPLVLSFWADPTVAPMMEAIKTQLEKRLRIRVVLEALERGPYLKKIYSGDYQMMNIALNVWIHDPSSNLDIFKFKHTTINGTGWSDPEYTRLLDLASEMKDPAHRNEYYRRAEECIMRQLPVIPICYQTCKYLKSPQLDGEAVSPVGIVELKWLKRQS